MQLRTPFLVWRGYTHPHTTPHFWSTATPLAFFVKLVFCRHLITLLKMIYFASLLSTVVLVHGGVWAVQTRRTVESVRSWSVVCLRRVEARSVRQTSDTGVWSFQHRRSEIRRPGLPARLLLLRVVWRYEGQNEVTDSSTMLQFKNTDLLKIVWHFDRPGSSTMHPTSTPGNGKE